MKVKVMSYPVHVADVDRVLSVRLSREDGETAGRSRDPLRREVGMDTSLDGPSLAVRVVAGGARVWLATPINYAVGVVGDERRYIQNVKMTNF